MNEKWKKSSSRPAISVLIKYELWGRSAGRCQFRGCPDLLYLDDLTQNRSNLGTISHIVSYSLNGPRGDAVRSKELETDIRNLMLTCKKHGKLMDDKDKKEEYPESLLLEFKKEHELRVRNQTANDEEWQTHVLLVNAAIDETNFEINQKMAFRAISPKYSATENPTIVNLSDVAVAARGEEFFSVMSDAITQRVGAFRNSFPSGRPDKSISLFALAPIPLLVHLGMCLGDIHEVDLFQRHRDKQSWEWMDSDEDEESIARMYKVSTPEPEDDGEGLPLALVVSLSAEVRDEQVEEVIGGAGHIYRIGANQPGLDFLKSKQLLELFGYELRKVLEGIRFRFGRLRPLHLIAAVPAPVAVEMGRCLRKYHPPVKVYEYRKELETYEFALEVNQ